MEEKARVGLIIIPVLHSTSWPGSRQCAAGVGVNSEYETLGGVAGQHKKWQTKNPASMGNKWHSYAVGLLLEVKQVSLTFHKPWRIF